MNYFSTAILYNTFRWQYLVTVLLLCTPISAHAGENCLDHALTQAEMNACAGEDRKNAETELNKAYAALQENISPEGKVMLRAARQAWEMYRKQQCEFNGLGSRAGSVHPVVMAECYAEFADAYAELLKKQLGCEEGVVSCGRQ